jgi:general secretion pathway protein A
MYESFFGLREPAFSLSPDPRFLWPSETHEEGLSALSYGISRREGFLLLTGAIGTGKTTLLRALLAELPADTDTALIMNTADLSGPDLLKLIAAELGLAGPFESKVDYIIALNAHLLGRLRTGVNTVLVIDEAHNIDHDTLEELRLLSNLETDSEKLLQIVLTGQPELRRKLADPRLRQLRQRIAIEHHLEPLGRLDVMSYLAHRIAVAGGRCDEIFAPGCEPAFFAFSQGCPRLISLLAERSLLSAYAKQLRPVPVALVEEKAKDMAEGHQGADPSELEFDIPET